MATTDPMDIHCDLLGSSAEPQELLSNKDFAMEAIEINGCDGPRLMDLGPGQDFQGRSWFVGWREGFLKMGGRNVKVQWLAEEAKFNPESTPSLECGLRMLVARRPSFFTVVPSEV